MKSVPLRWAVLLILSGMLGYGAARWLGARQSASAVPPDVEPSLSWLRSTFPMPDPQFEKVATLHREYDVRCRQMCADLAEANRRLEATMRSNEVWSVKVEAALAEAARLRAHCQGETLKHVYEVSQAMPREQGDKYREWMARNLLIPARMPHGPGPAAHSHE